MRTPKGKTGIEMFREYFQLQQSAPLSAVEQSIMTHIIWLMNENLSEEVQITLRQLSARSNVDVRTLKAKLPQLCNKNYLKYAEIEGEVCKVAYKNVSKSGTISESCENFFVIFSEFFSKILLISSKIFMKILQDFSSTSSTSR